MPDVVDLLPQSEQLAYPPHPYPPPFPVRLLVYIFRLAITTIV